MNHLAELNPAQREAVQTLHGPLLILAGAGSGKTRVITYRMAQLIASGVVPDRILSVTFTNKAAREMQERATALLGKKMPKKPLVCTFHSLCVRILRQEITALGYPLDFAICDRGDQESIARTALREIRVSEKSLKPGDLLSIISKWKTHGIHPAEAREAAENDREFLAAAAYRKYQTNLKNSASVDFDDLLFLTQQLFRGHPEVLARYQSRFSHVQIDEYQDTNGMQFEIVESLVRLHRNLCVVGDDDQSIYGWRGAEVKHILDFPQMFPGTHVIRLEDNYRCTDKILELANQLVKHNRERHNKKLVAHKVGPNSVRISEFPDEETEAVEVVREINWIIKSKNVDPADIAILFRTNEQPRVFETELRRAKLPYVLLGSMSFFDRREIRDLLAYLKVLAHPEDEISLLRIINVPARGIGSGTVEKLLSRAVQQKSRVWQVIPEALTDPQLPPAARMALNQFRNLILKYREQFLAYPQQMSRLVKELLQEINYEAEVRKQYDEPAEQDQRMESLAELTNALSQYESRVADPTLNGFLEDSALTGRDEEIDKDEQLSRQGIKLMTLHSAKGLEFNRVFLVGMEEGLLPHRRALEDAEQTIPEERRLCYVGITRARDHLTLTRATSRMKWGKPRPTMPSRFLYEMTGRQKPLNVEGEEHADEEHETEPEDVDAAS
ncbi:MAG: UvrD-helicase domain-containing protein [Planctomycetes bacterium]|nr:UvrD-helicase domain-containing protein [Planctomycetota bacterium]